MRLSYFHILAAAVLMLPPTGRLLAEDADPADAGSKPAQMNLSDLPEQPIFQVAETTEQFAGTAPADNVWLEFEDVPEAKILGARFGWWGTHNTGSLTKTGEYQGLRSSSPFLDVDGLASDGRHTVDFFATMPEDETTQAYLHFYGGPGLTANVDFEKFLHRLDHVPLEAAGWNPVAPTAPAGVPVTSPFFGQDLNVGRDYAIQVQQLKANFKGELTENLRWRLNLWGMEKEGTRNAGAVTHCYATAPATAPATTNQRCHLQNQSQQIDWLTMQIEPAVEWRVTEGFTLEYSRTMRNLTQNDQVVLRSFVANEQFPAGTPPLTYDLVPDSSTQIDRIKAAADLGMNTDLYVLGYNGDNTNDFRGINRHFAGTDARITNTAVDGVSVTGYGKVYTEQTAMPSTPLGTVGYNQIYQELTLGLMSPPVNRDEGVLGAKGRWRPFHDCDLDSLERGLCLDGGYEYRDLRRSNATYVIEVRAPAAPRSFTEPSTISNRFWAGVSEEWTREFSTSLRYTFIDTRYPLIGVTSIEENADIFSSLNTNLPTHEDRIELGGTWNLADNLMLNGTFYLERTYNHSDFAFFDEDNYPFVLSAWYAPTCRWSVSGGYAQMTNYINQDITYGDKSVAQVGAGNAAFTGPVQYLGKSDVLTLSTSYAATERLTVTGGGEYVRGSNAITNAVSPGSTALPYNNDLITYSRVDVTTWRLSAGADYLLRRGVSTFFRYNYFDFSDATESYNTGTTSQFLAGLTGTY